MEDRFLLSNTTWIFVELPLNCMLLSLVTFLTYYYALVPRILSLVDDLNHRSIGLNRKKNNPTVSFSRTGPPASRRVSYSYNLKVCLNYGTPEVYPKTDPILRYAFL